MGGYKCIRALWQNVWNDFDSLSARAVPFSLCCPSFPWMGQSTQPVLHTCRMKQNKDLSLLSCCGIDLLNWRNPFLGQGWCAFWVGCFCLENVLMKLLKWNVTALEIDSPVITLSFQWSWQFGEFEAFFLIISFKNIQQGEMKYFSWKIKPFSKYALIFTIK
jgi:hypothetical protein